MTVPEPGDIDVRSDLAMVVGSTLRAEGYRYVTPSACYAVADALTARPGLLIAAVGDRPSDRRTERPTGLLP